MTIQIKCDCFHVALFIINETGCKASTTAKGQIYEIAQFRLTKLVFFRARTMLEENTATFPVYYAEDGSLSL